MGIVSLFDARFYGGSGVSSLVPNVFPVGINGRPYLIDNVRPEWFAHYRLQGLNVIRQQSDTSTSPGEQTITPEGLWRRAQLDFSHGAGQCLTPETRVLTADLRWIPCGDLQVGDELVAFEEEATNRRARQWKTATVTDTGIITMPCYRLLLSDGTKIVASANHKWLKVVNEQFHWTVTSSLRPASSAAAFCSKLVKVFEPWAEDRSWGTGYLAAAFDGEGSLTQTARPPRKDRLMLAFTQRPNAMLETVKAELKARGFDFSLGGYAGKNGDVAQLNLLGGTTELLRFLGSVRPLRLLAKWKPLNNGVMWGKPVEVLEREFIGEQEVVALQTSTQTFIAEGFATHNTYRDRPDSDILMFRSSKGLNPWVKWQLTLQPDTANVYATTNANLNALTLGTHYYITDGAALKYANTLASPTFTTVTGGPVSNLVGLATNGTTLYVATGANGIYTTTEAAATMASYVTGTVNVVGYVKGRLMCAAGASIYNVTASGALPAALFTHGNSSFTWVGFAEGPGQIYAAGYAGQHSLIYRSAVKTDGTVLDPPIVAGELPTGEIVASIFGYLGFVVIGTNLGVRFASLDQAGNLIIGSLISTPSTVSALGGAQSRFVWFGWSNFDSASTGLGRLDLTIFTIPDLPAYASDLMATGQGSVVAVENFSGKRIFGVSGLGYFGEQTTVVTSGTMYTGRITYSLPDPKVAMFVDVQTEPLVGTVAVALSADLSTTYTSIGSLSTALQTSASLNAGQTRARVFELLLTLTRSGPTDTVGPTLDRWTLRSYPAPSVGLRWTLPLLLHEKVSPDGGPAYSYDVEYERQLFEQLNASRQLVQLQVGNATYPAFVSNITWVPHHEARTRNYNGTLIVDLDYLPI